MKLPLMLGCTVAALLILAPVSARADDKDDTRPEPIYLGYPVLLSGDWKAAGKFLIAGNRAVDAGRAEEGIAIFEAAIKACPSPAAVLGLARCAVLQGDYQTALQRYESVIEDPQTFIDIRVLTEYAQTLRLAGQRKNALAVYNRLVELCKRGRAPRELEVALPSFHSDYSEIRFNAMLHVIAAISSRRKSKKSVTEIEQAASLAPESSIVLFYKGVVLKDNHPHEATLALKKALRFDDGTNTPIINKWLVQAQEQENVVPASHP